MGEFVPRGEHSAADSGRRSALTHWQACLCITAVVWLALAMPRRIAAGGDYAGLRGNHALPYER